MSGDRNNKTMLGIQPFRADGLAGDDDPVVRQREASKKRTDKPSMAELADLDWDVSLPGIDRVDESTPAGPPVPDASVVHPSDDAVLRTSPYLSRDFADELDLASDAFGSRQPIVMDDELNAGDDAPAAQTAMFSAREIKAELDGEAPVRQAPEPTPRASAPTGTLMLSGADIAAAIEGSSSAGEARSGSLQSSTRQDASVGGAPTRTLQFSAGAVHAALEEAASSYESTSVEPVAGHSGGVPGEARESHDKHALPSSRTMMLSGAVVRAALDKGEAEGAGPDREAASSPRADSARVSARPSMNTLQQAAIDVDAVRAGARARHASGSSSLTESKTEMPGARVRRPGTRSRGSGADVDVGRSPGAGRGEAETGGTTTTGVGVEMTNKPRSHPSESSARGLHDACAPEAPTSGRPVNVTGAAARKADSTNVSSTVMVVGAASVGVVAVLAFLLYWFVVR